MSSTLEAEKKDERKKEKRGFIEWWVRLMLGNEDRQKEWERKAEKMVRENRYY